MLLPLAATIAIMAPPDPSASDSLAGLSGGRARANVEALVGFGTRHTLSETESDERGIGAARRWILAELQSYGGRLEAKLERFEAPPGRRLPDGAEIVNIVAVLPGTMPEAAHRRYYVLGHYDSRNSDGLDGAGDAPGANDDASGVAVVMELARTLADTRLDATVVFLCTAGEEQGLYGARYHVESALARGEDIGGALSLDMVGDPSVPPGIEDLLDARRHVRVFSQGAPRQADAETQAQISSLGAESDSPQRQLARFVRESGALEQTPVQAMMVFRNDRFLRGGDHTPFVDAGLPAVRFTVVYEDYTRQHQDLRVEDGVRYGDTLEHVDATYLDGVAQLVGSTLVRLANAPSAPGEARIITAELTSDTTLRWAPSPEPDVAGYEVVWRLTTEPDWTGALDVGSVTEATIPLSKDNWLFGVRAYDAAGWRSVVAFPVAARR
ncbi:MAG: M28 family metallopeptidase [Phycisphaerales bacterium JB039]